MAGMVDLSGKTALVTGAGQGVGFGIAMAMSAAGANTVLAGRTLAKVEEAAKDIEGRGGGTIINLATSAGVRWDMAGYGPYGAVKQAIRVLIRAAASEWGAQNIRVLTIAPHALSPGLQWWTEAYPEEAAEFIGAIPLGRIGALEEDIGQAVAALCGPEFAYLTGATIPLDGGQANFD